MKRVFAFLAIICVAATSVAQDMTVSGVYDKRGKAVVLDEAPMSVNVTLTVASEHFVPGVYARFAQKYLGQRATLSEYSTIEIVDGRIAKGEVAKNAIVVEEEPVVSPLPINRLSAAAQNLEAQAAATAEMIFTLRRSRLDLIMGEIGEHVYGAGMKAALEEIDRIEKECLEMFYGKKSSSLRTYSYNVPVTSDKNEYIVCRFNDQIGVVDANDLSGKPILIKIETEKNKSYSELRPVGEKDKLAVDYYIVPKSKCLLIAGTTLLDTFTFVSSNYAIKVESLPIK